MKSRQVSQPRPVIESLEARECFSASPLPVLMVLPNQDYATVSSNVRELTSQPNDTAIRGGWFIPLLAT